MLKCLEDISLAFEGLALLPASYPVVDKEKDAQLRKMVFQSRTIVLYTYDEASVYIESIVDARSNWHSK